MCTYPVCVGLSGAAKSLSEVLVEVYEPEWDGSDEFKNYAEVRELGRRGWCDEGRVVGEGLV